MLIIVEVMFGEPISNAINMLFKKYPNLKSYKIKKIPSVEPFVSQNGLCIAVDRTFLVAESEEKVY